MSKTPSISSKKILKAIQQHNVAYLTKAHCIMNNPLTEDLTCFDTITKVLIQLNEKVPIEHIYVGMPDVIDSLNDCYPYLKFQIPQFGQIYHHFNFILTIDDDTPNLKIVVTKLNYANAKIEILTEMPTSVYNNPIAIQQKIVNIISATDDPWDNEYSLDRLI